MTIYHTLTTLRRLADDGDVIQARQLVDMFPGRPEHHTTMSVWRALSLIEGMSETEAKEACDESA